MCCGFRALEMDAGRVWKPLTTTRSGSAEKLQEDTRKSCCRLRSRFRLMLEGSWCALQQREPSLMTGGSGSIVSRFKVALAVAVVKLLIVSSSSSSSQLARR